MNIWTISFIIGDLCIGFYAIFLIVKGIIYLGNSDLKDYMEKNENVCVREEKHPKANFSINGNATIEIFKLVILLLLPVIIFFCPIINILLCLLLVCVRHNKEAIYKVIKEKAIEYTEKSKNSR